MVKNNEQQMTDEVVCFDLTNFNKAEEAIEEMRKFLEKYDLHKPKVKDIRFSTHDRNTSYEYSSDDINTGLYFYFKRPETDEEMMHRLDQERKRKEAENMYKVQREQHEQKEYERLKKKYGKKGNVLE